MATNGSSNNRNGEERSSDETMSEKMALHDLLAGRWVAIGTRRVLLNDIADSIFEWDFRKSRLSDSASIIN
eukprot:scaffold270_cov207-Alexandrium_tamarense.AAC.26